MPKCRATACAVTVLRVLVEAVLESRDVGADQNPVVEALYGRDVQICGGDEAVGLVPAVVVVQYPYDVRIVGVYGQEVGSAAYPLGVFVIHVVARGVIRVVYRHVGKELGGAVHVVGEEADSLLGAGVVLRRGVEGEAYLDDVLEPLVDGPAQLEGF